MNPNMDPTRFDFLNLDESTPSETPDLGASVEPFPLNDINELIGLDDAGAGSSSNQEDVAAAQTPSGTGYSAPTANTGDAFPYPLGPMQTTGQSQLFVDPQLYDDTPDSHDEGARSQIQVRQEGISSPSTRRTSEFSNSTSVSRRESRESRGSRESTDVTPPEQEPERKRKVPKKASTALTPEEEEERRKRALERNRQAAGRCREKKKAYQLDLEAKVKRLEEENRELGNEHRRLYEELNGLKQLLMLHARCCDPNIDRWFGAKARAIVDRKDKEFAEAAMACGLEPQPGPATGPLHGRSLSNASVYPPLERTLSNRSVYPSPDDPAFDALGQRQGSISYSHESGPMYHSQVPDAAGFPAPAGSVYHSPVPDAAGFPAPAGSVYSPDVESFPGAASAYSSPTKDSVFSGSGTLFPSPTKESAFAGAESYYPEASQEVFKTEPGLEVNYNPMESMYTPDGSTYGGV